MCACKVSLDIRAVAWQECLSLLLLYSSSTRRQLDSPQNRPQITAAAQFAAVAVGCCEFISFLSPSFSLFLHWLVSSTPCIDVLFSASPFSFHSPLVFVTFSSICALASDCFLFTPERAVDVCLKMPFMMMPFVCQFIHYFGMRCGE